MFILTSQGNNASVNISREDRESRTKGLPQTKHIIYNFHQNNDSGYA